MLVDHTSCGRHAALVAELWLVQRSNSRILFGVGIPILGFATPFKVGKAPKSIRGSFPSQLSCCGKPGYCAGLCCRWGGDGRMHGPMVPPTTLLGQVSVPVGTRGACSAMTIPVWGLTKAWGPRSKS